MAKANTSSVISYLKGSLHGHLGLDIPDAKCNKNRGYPYTTPSHPGDLKIAENTPLHEANIMRELQIKKLKLFLETIAIESAIKSQIVAAIDPIYLKELKNSTTETKENTISQILMHLFQEYGQIP